MFTCVSSDKFVLDLADSDDEDEGGRPESSAAVAQRRIAKLKKLDRHGIALQPCKHVFCGVSTIRTVGSLARALIEASFGSGLSLRRDLPKPEDSLRPLDLRRESWNLFGFFYDGSERWEDGVPHGLPGALIF